MSRIGKQPITIPAGVTVNIENRKITARGPLGEESVDLIDGIDVNISENVLSISSKKADVDKKQAAYWGLSRSLINNIILGVSSGFEKGLEIVGVGYRATQQNNDVLLQLGFSHNITFSPPEGITLQVVDPLNIKVKGSNKELVGQIAANIRKIRPPEPYKGKGIRYKNEYIRKKAGKTGK